MQSYFLKNEVLMITKDMNKFESRARENRVHRILQKKWVVFTACILAVSTLIFLFFSDKMNRAKESEFALYKTEVNESKVNKFGQLTLNEVMIDDNQILLNATFEPVKDLDAPHQIFFFPQVLVNGQDYTVRNGGQSIVKTDSKYTIYNSVKLNDLPQDVKLDLAISYNNWNVEKPIEDPWEFQIEASQKQMLSDKKVFPVNTSITLTDGQEIIVEKVVSTPISTTIYFDSEKPLNKFSAFKLQSISGKSWRFDSSYTLNEKHSKWAMRFDALYLKEKTYDLIPLAADDEIIGPSIRISEE